MNTTRYQRVPQLRIAETVAAELRNRILAEDDYRLPVQEQLVNDFGVSYPSIREALRILETEGLVTVRRGSVGGADVHRPDEFSAAYHLGLSLQAARVTLKDLATALQILQPLCAAECTKRPDRSEVVVPALTASINTSAKLLETGVPFTQAAKEFHDLIVSFTPNAAIRHVVKSYAILWSSQEKAWEETISQYNAYQTETEPALCNFRQIVKAISAGRANEAERLTRSQLTIAQSVVLQSLGNSIAESSIAMSRQTIHSIRSSRS